MTHTTLYYIRQWYPKIYFRILSKIYSPPLPSEHVYLIQGGKQTPTENHALSWVFFVLYICVSYYIYYYYYYKFSYIVPPPPFGPGGGRGVGVDGVGDAINRT